MATSSYSPSDVPSKLASSVPSDVPQKDPSESPSRSVVEWKGKSFLLFLYGYWKENLFCKTMKQQQSSNPPELHIELGSCQKFLEKSALGTGNVLTAIYGVRLAAMKLNVDWQISCDGARKTLTNSVLPWVMGKYKANESELSSFQQPSNTRPEKCPTFNHAPIGLIAETMQLDLRRMALSLVSPPAATHPAWRWARLQDFADSRYRIPETSIDSPLFPNVILDDTTIHFRGGDLLKNQHKRYGFMRFDVYKRLIEEFHTPKSIGIVTQTFHVNATTNSYHRKADIQQGERHRLLVTTLAGYLQQAFPTTRIQIHSEDAIPLSYARMILSNQTIGAFSSFAVFPAIATFGTGFLRNPNGDGPYQWISKAPLPTNLELFDAPNILRPAVLNYVWKKLGFDVLKKWLWAEISSKELKELVVLHEQQEKQSRRRKEPVRKEHKETRMRKKPTRHDNATKVKA